jgi:hypothetical protein
MEIGRMQRHAFASSFVEVVLEQGLAGQIVFGPNSWSTQLQSVLRDSSSEETGSHFDVDGDQEMDNL